MTQSPPLIELAKAAKEARKAFEADPMNERVAKAWRMADRAYQKVSGPEAIQALIDQLATARNDALEEAAKVAEREELHCLEAAKIGDAYMSGSHGAGQAIKNEILALQTPAPVPPAKEEK